MLPFLLFLLSVHMPLAEQSGGALNSSNGTDGALGARYPRGVDGSTTFRERRRCMPEVKFRTCCQQIGLKINLGGIFGCRDTKLDVASLIDEVCKFPPSTDLCTRTVLSDDHIAKIQQCFADGADNRECCVAIMPDIKRVCRDHFCTANRGPIVQYKNNRNDCEQKTGISVCNYRQRMDTDTAMQRFGTCKGAFCDRPYQWKEHCRR